MMALDGNEHIRNILQSEIAERFSRLQREASMRCRSRSFSVASAQQIAAPFAQDRLDCRE
ncbi:hypothetical protein DY468_16375 [Rhodopseudomonas sp. BR0M22]|nr:hypothetical protein [Rhodopseudomonas sp. BR0M22]